MFRPYSLLACVVVACSVGGAVRADDDHVQREVQMLDFMRESIARRLAEEDDPAAQLLGSLGLLDSEVAEFRVAAIRQLAELSPPEGESIAEWIERSERELWASDVDWGLRARAHRERYRILAGRELTWTWETRRAEKLAFLEAVQAARTDDDPATSLQSAVEKADDGDARARLVEAYLALLELRRPEVVDVELLRGYVSADGVTGLERLSRHLSAVTTLHRVGAEPDDRLERTLVATVERAGEDVAGWNLTLIQNTIRRFLRYGRPEVRREVMRIVVQEWPPHSGRGFLSFARGGNGSLLQTFLARPVEIDVEGTPLRVVVARLGQESALPLWIEPQVLEDESPVTVSAKGTWLSVARRVLADSDHELSIVGDEVVWIGPRKAREAAETRIRNAAARARGVRRLSEPSEIEFVDLPIDEGLMFLSDLHDVSIVNLYATREILERPVTTTLRWSPMYVVLERVTSLAGLEWTTLGERLILVAPRERAADLRALRERHRELEVRIDQHQLEGRLPTGLRDATEAQFIDVPLEEGMKFFGDLHEAKVVPLGPEQDVAPLNLVISGVTLETALTLALSQHGLEWDFDDETIVYGTPERIAKFRKRAEGGE